MMMGKKIGGLLKMALLIWGGLSLAIAISLAGYVVLLLDERKETQTGKATNNDVAFVLNWTQLGQDRIERVVNSYSTARSITGDHLDAYEIQVTSLEAGELTSANAEATGRWYNMNKMPVVLAEAVSFVDGAQHEIPWFPTEDQLRSQNFFVYPLNIVLHGTRPISAQLIFAHPSTKKIYYVSLKT